MKKELDKQLVEKYPAIFKNRYGNPRETAMCFGFEHGDGWYHIIDVLCSQLYSKYRQAEHRYNYARRHEGTKSYNGEVIDAVAVERLRLAMKEAYDNIPVAVQVKEKFGTLRFYVDRGNDRIYNLINFAEAMSSRTCEECGAVGKERYGGWIRTLCDAHAASAGYSLEDDDE